MTPILIIIAFCLAVYLPTIKNYIVFDDDQWFSRIKSGFFKNRNILKAIQLRLYGGGTFAGDLNKTKFDLEWDHLFRICLYTLACVLIYLAFGKSQISFWAAILFAIHPINNQISLWLNGRRYLINVILVNVIILMGAWGILAYLLTPAFQLTAIFAPILLFKYSPWYLLAIPVMVALGWKSMSAKLKTRFEIVLDADRREFHPRRFIVATKYYGHYFFKMLIPGVCSLIYPKTYYWGITEEGNKDAYSFNLEFYKGLAALILSGLLIAVLPNDYKPYAVFMVLATAQWCSFIPIQDYADRYCNVSNIFMMFFVSFFAHKYLGVYAPIFLAGLAMYYFGMLKIIMPMYRNIASFWEYHRYHIPQLASPRKFEIDRYIKKGDLFKALYLVDDALRYRPNDYIFNRQAAILNQAIGQTDKARYFADVALRNTEIGRKESQTNDMMNFIKSLPMVDKYPSRQVRRAAEREEEKEKKKTPPIIYDQDRGSFVLQSNEAKNAAV